MNFIGLDLSVNNTGMVVIDEKKKIIDYLYFRDTVTPQHNKIILPKHFHDKQHINLTMKINFVSINLFNILNKYKDSFVGVEGYSYNSKSNSTTKLAELGGYIKLMLLAGGFKYEIFPPCAVKKCVTGNGFAKKEETKKVCLENIKKIPWSEDYTGFDLYDALSIALFARTYYIMGDDTYRKEKIVWKRLKFNNRVS